MNIRKTSVLAVVAALTWTGSAGAQETPPPGGEPREYQLPAADTVRMDNGLRVTMVPFGEIPKVTIAVVVEAGNLNEGDETWLADLTGEMMLEGAGGRNTDELAGAVASMGGQLAVGVGVARTQIAADVLSEFGAELVDVLADVVRRPHLPQSELARVRDNMLKNLAIAQTQPQTQADEAFRSKLYGDHPYGVGLPDPDDFSAFDVDDVRRFHTVNFGAARTHIYVAGRFDREAVRAAIESAFGDWPAGPAPYGDIPAGDPAPGTVLIDRDGAPQSTVFLGLPVVDPSSPDYVALSVLNTLLGGSFSSRITSNIREDKGYTYSPRSRVTARYRNAYWLQTADITTESTGPAIAEVVKEIRRLQDEAPDADELTRFKNYRTGTFVLGNATRGGLIGQLQFLDTHGLDRTYLTEYVSRMNAITPEEVQRMARRYITPETMTLVIVGDLDVVRPQLDALPDLGIELPQ